MSRILLAEDDRVIRDITVMYLTKNGLQVDVTDNGNSACQLIEMNRYDCIVLDIMMPGKDGREVCRLIRNNDTEGKPTMFAPIMIATLSTCAQLERENIKFRLNSGRKLYIERA